MAPIEGAEVRNADPASQCLPPLLEPVTYSPHKEDGHEVGRTYCNSKPAVPSMQDEGR